MLSGNTPDGGARKQVAAAAQAFGGTLLNDSASKLVAGACYQRYLALLTALDISALVRMEAKP
jgi:hypothetical protein